MVPQQAAPEPVTEEPVPAPAPAEEPKAEPAQPKERTVVERIFLLARETTVYPDGSVSEISTFTYAADDSMLIVKKETADSRRAPLETTSYEYADGRLARVTVKDGAGKQKSQRVYTYAQDGRLVSESLSGRDGKLASVSRYEYGAHGEKTRWSVLDGSNTLLGATAYAYQDGRNVRMDLVNAQGKAERSVFIEYDGDRRVKEVYRLPSGETEKSILSSWKNGLLVSESSFNASGQPVSRVEYAYDDDGNVKSVLTYDRTGTLTMTRNREYAERNITRVVRE